MIRALVPNGVAYIKAGGTWTKTVIDQLESVWPVHGSVLVENDPVYCVAGRPERLRETSRSTSARGLER